jgi:hypothetical protein
MPTPASSGTGELQAMRVTRQLPDITNNKCPTCGLVNRVGVLVCENCGTSLISGAASVPSTRSLQDKSGGTGQLTTDRLPPDKLLEIEKLPLTTLRIENRSILETAQSGVTEDTILKLEIPGASQPLMVLPKREVMVGRKDLTTGTQPDLDLTPFAGYRMGVSRRHAVFRMYDRRIEVVDLGSSNGSRLNGILLHAHQPYLLRDGDLLTLGKMEMRVSFHQPPPRITRA